MPNHYIRTDASNYVTKAFSDAFRQPEADDICVAEGTPERHFNLDLFDGEGNHRYRWDPGSKKVVERAEAERATLDALKAKRKAEVSKVALRVLAATDWKAIRHRDQVDNGEATTLSDAEYHALLNARKSVRDAAAEKETEIDALSDRASVEAHAMAVE